MWKPSQPPITRTLARVEVTAHFSFGSCLCLFLLRSQCHWEYDSSHPSPWPVQFKPVSVRSRTVSAQFVCDFQVAKSSRHFRHSPFPHYSTQPTASSILNHAHLLCCFSGCSSVSLLPPVHQDTSSPLFSPGNLIRPKGS